MKYSFQMSASRCKQYCRRCVMSLWHFLKAGSSKLKPGSRGLEHCALAQCSARTCPRACSRGFTLLLAALVASLVLSLGAAIFGIAQKSVTLSTLGRDSQFAFYAADSAAECALYFDVRQQLFSTTSSPTQITCDSPPNPISTITTTLPGGSWPPTQFTFSYQPNGYCAEVTVIKSNTKPYTTIHADGYSVPCADKSSNPRALQRSVELHY